MSLQRNIDKTRHNLRHTKTFFKNHTHVGICKKTCAPLYILYTLGTFENAQNVQSVNNATLRIKNGALIVREKWSCGEFLRTFEEG